jgi:hypothetical protein
LRSLFLSKDGKKLKNYKVQMMHMDLLDLKKVEAHVMYAYDEAFDDRVYNHMINLFLESVSAIYLITFKTVKNMPGRKARRSNLVKPPELKILFKGTIPNKGNGHSAVIMAKKKQSVCGDTLATVELPWLPNTIEYALEKTKELLADMHV